MSSRSHKFNPRTVKWTQHAEILDHQAPITVLSVSPDRTYLASGDEMGHLSVSNASAHTRLLQVLITRLRR